jgi:alpha-D-ribose 1-methylphosphonate 5-triphosphate diphosphatase
MPPLAPTVTDGSAADSAAGAARQGWRFGRPPADYAVRGVRAVTPDRLIEDATVIVRDGVIRDIVEGGRDEPGAVDGAGLLLLPGLVDVHSDALEIERMPRPATEVPLAFALASFEGRVTSAGTTTMFHGAGFQHKSVGGVVRDPERALETCEMIDAASTSYRVDHRVLHRLDVLSAEGAEVLRRRIDALPADAHPPLVSHEDHTPGQGQFTDPEGLRPHMRAQGMGDAEIDAELAARMRKRESLLPVRAANLAWLSELALARRIRLLGHDPASTDDIEELAGRGGAVAEFPTTLAAARSARDHGLLVVGGAPNVLRGGSHSGNVAAGELVAAGLVDALASDYLPTSLLAAVAILVREGVATLPQAVSLVSLGPARVAGLDDRGAIAPGMRADLALVDDRHGDWPRVVQTLGANVA